MNAPMTDSQERNGTAVREFHRFDFSKGTKGYRGVCSSRGCLRNAVVTLVSPAHYHYGVGVMNLARCDLHPEPTT